MNFFGPGVGPDLLAQLANGIGGHPVHPRQFNQYLKAYSVAMLPGKERENLSYGGKIIMPPSALAHLTSLDIQSPWKFKLSNPANPAASTHAGVLEFIAQEGVVHLPYWMMKTLRLNEGDAIRITGADLPKGKMVKIQAQSVHFLEVSDPKAVLEQALRNFSCLTQGDTVEIIYNSIVFGFLIMETSPGGEGIDVLNTDLEVDFATPKGYVEPERPKAAPPATMASKLKIDLNQQTPGSSRPSSSQSGMFVGPPRVGGTTLSKDGETWESFKGKGQTLEGRKTKGKGISHRKAEDVSSDSRIIRTDKPRLVTNSSLEHDSQAPAPLNLPPGKLFFGYRYVEYISPDSDEKKEKPKSKEVQDGTNSNSWGGGHKLGRGAWKPSEVTGAGGASVPVLPARIGKSTADEAEDVRSPSPDFGVDDDEMIDYDSD
ncbi:ubiquitin fusion degradation protein I [Thelephora terrestris]|uniref:Ubiquitin fusion degradation protein I n=1 Tax=Thelephora terrestris TaxID=56493 RepID=A0A9P6HQ25_9AGAM|nr:ubiquitin fusion degradation protein I [Thelephora terrestris]